MRGRQRCQVDPTPRGFTFLEVMLVVVILAVLAVVAYPMAQSSQAVKAAGSIRKMLADVRHAQQLAVTRGAKYAVELDPTNNRYRVYEVATGINVTDPVSGNPGVSGQSWSSGLVMIYPTDPNFKGVGIVSVTVLGTPGGDGPLRSEWQTGGSPATVEFDSLGRHVVKDSGGTVRSTSTSDQTEIRLRSPDDFSVAGDNRYLDIWQEGGGSRTR